ncbi:hypothetical protein PPERSA_09611 [Pseudocohnilembus persalinus]|uniref:Uncharacterized protein n=1 Tax=Pseudocohnilembus persalinus TaxID=266149 RepID=A0A0V0QFM9_PSEPJ|nr:hypothetical protein PPERSA_09611 [Pseudocohnilembus persalinus]|eukprot:KRX01005.1 hypothetical protein PPERSA_09611 [Pseudocohnilembus persalinus]
MENSEIKNMPNKYDTYQPQQTLIDQMNDVSEIQQIARDREDETNYSDVFGESIGNVEQIPRFKGKHIGSDNKLHIDEQKNEKMEENDKNQNVQNLNKENKIEYQQIQNQTKEFSKNDNKSEPKNDSSQLNKSKKNSENNLSRSQLAEKKSFHSCKRNSSMIQENMQNQKKEEEQQKAMKKEEIQEQGIQQQNDNTEQKSDLKQQEVQNTSNNQQEVSEQTFKPASYQSPEEIDQEKKEKLKQRTQMNKLYDLAEILLKQEERIQEIQKQVLEDRNDIINSQDLKKKVIENSNKVIDNIMYPDINNSPSKNQNQNIDKQLFKNTWMNNKESFANNQLFNTPLERHQANKKHFLRPIKNQKQHGQQYDTSQLFGGQEKILNSLQQQQPKESSKSIDTSIFDTAKLNKEQFLMQVKMSALEQNKINPNNLSRQNQSILGLQMEKSKNYTGYNLSQNKIFMKRNSSALENSQFANIGGSRIVPPSKTQVIQPVLMKNQINKTNNKELKRKQWLEEQEKIKNGEINPLTLKMEKERALNEKKLKILQQQQIKEEQNLNYNKQTNSYYKQSVMPQNYLRNSKLKNKNSILDTNNKQNNKNNSISEFGSPNNKQVEQKSQLQIQNYNQKNSLDNIQNQNIRYKINTLKDNTGNIKQENSFQVEKSVKFQEMPNQTKYKKNYI